VILPPQGWEIWKGLGPWVSQHNPSFGPGIKDRFQMASNITQEEFQAADERRSM
jgi:amidase